MDQKSEPLLVRVFTPARPATLTFVERDSINDQLVDALRTPGKQLVVFGHTGSGKSTVLRNKLDQIYEGYITTRCMDNMTFDQLLLDAFDQLNKYYVAEVSEGHKVEISQSLRLAYWGIKASLGLTSSQESQTKQQRVVPPQLTAQRLGQFIGETSCCWVLEDFHKMASGDKPKLSQMMKVFMDMAVDYPFLKIIALGAVNTARAIVDLDPEMTNRVAEIPVPLMSRKELSEILKKGEAHLNICFSSDVTEGILRYSNGLASVCHQLALDACRAADINDKAESTVNIEDKEFEAALKQYVLNSSDSLKKRFDKAIRTQHNQKHDGFRYIIEVLAESEEEDGMSRSDILHGIRSKAYKYPGTALTAHLNQLQDEKRGAIIRWDEASGKYSFTSPFYRVYALIRFSSQRRRKTDITQLISEMQRLTLSLWESNKSGTVMSFRLLQTSANNRKKDAHHGT